VDDFDGRNPVEVMTRHKSSKAIKVVGIHQALDDNMKEKV